MGPVWVGRQINKASDQEIEEGGLDPIKLSLASPRNGWPGSNSCSTLWGPASGGSQTAHKIPRAWVTLRGGGCVATPTPPPRVLRSSCLGYGWEHWAGIVKCCKLR